MRKPTPLKLAIVTTGRRQKDIAADLGIDEANFSRIVNGLHCNDDLKKKIASEVDRHVDELWPSMEAAA